MVKLHLTPISVIQCASASSYPYPLFPIVLTYFEPTITVYVHVVASLTTVLIKVSNQDETFIRYLYASAVQFVALFYFSESISLVI